MRPLDNKNKILQGSALDRLKEFDSDSIDCCVTSPPYWALRDYKIEGQLGSEPTFHKYLDNLIEIFAEVKRVIKKEGSIWVNIGDTYGRGSRNSQVNDTVAGDTIRQPISIKQPKGRDSGIPDKSLCGIPERFAIRMTDELGLIRRNTIIWYKPNCMPSSAKDRFTVDFEYIYFFTKSPKYFFETQYEPLILDPYRINNAKKMGWNGKSNYTDWYFNEREKKSWHDHKADKEQGYGQQTRGQKKIKIHHPLGRQKRCVWKISTRAFSEAHFAVYPPQLIEPMIKAGCPEQICNKCGKPRKLVYEETKIATRPGLSSKYDGEPFVDGRSKERKNRVIVTRMPKFGGNRAAEYGNPTYSGKEWNPVSRVPQQTMTDCGCNAGFTPGIVLDPFFGAGTTGIVALQQHKSFIGIELSPAYVKLAGDRLAKSPYLLQKSILDESFLTVKLNCTVDSSDK